MKKIKNLSHRLMATWQEAARLMYSANEHRIELF